jgi:hypothetical protein
VALLGHSRAALRVGVAFVLALVGGVAILSYWS